MSCLYVEPPLVRVRSYGTDRHPVFFVPFSSHRTVIPVSAAPNVRKLSKIATLLLAKNHILMQQRVIDELRAALEIYMLHFNSGTSGGDNTVPSKAITARSDTKK